MHVLCLETLTAGHVALYLDCLVSHTARNPEPSVTFAVDERILDTVAPATREHLTRQPHLRVLALSPEDLESRYMAGPIGRAIAQWALAARLLRRTRADHVHFLYADFILLPLLLRCKMPRHATVSGILFRPTLHYAELGSPPEGWREKTRHRIKKLLYRGALANPCLTRLFAMDPLFPDFVERSYRAPGRVVHLPEPVPWAHGAAEEKKPELIRSCGENRTIFLLFGSLTARKGLHEVLHAVRLLDPRTARSVGVVFCGELCPQLHDSFLVEYRATVTACPDVALRLDNRFVPLSELRGFVQHSDIVLCTYGRHVGSSNVLFLAGATHKPVIASDYGLIGWQVREFGLGIPIAPRNPAALATAMARAVEIGSRKLARSEGQKAFCAGHSPEEFARTIMDGISGHAPGSTRSPATKGMRS